MTRDNSLPLNPNMNAGKTVSFAVIHTKEMTVVPGEQTWFYNTLLSLGDAIIATDEAGKVIAGQVECLTRAEGGGCVIVRFPVLFRRHK